MDYRRFADTYYIRLDPGDEVMASLLDVCAREHIASCTFSGIGGCSDAVIQVFDRERGAFDDNRVEAMLELVQLTGSVFGGCEAPSIHAHALFAYHKDAQQHILAGHLKSSTVLYTAEIELRPVREGTIASRHDAQTGTHFWEFD